MSRLIMAVGVLVVVVLIGVVVTRPGSPERGDPTGGDVGLGQVEPAGTDAAASDDDIGDHPQAAAVRAVALTGDVVTAGFISRRVMIDSFTTSRFGTELADATSSQVTALLLELGARDADPASLRVIEQPLSARTISEGPDRAVVEVWSMLVVAVPGAGPGRQVWRTVRVELVADELGWLVDGWTSTLGPTPALAPQATISEADAVLDVLEWPRVLTITRRPGVS